VKAMTELGTFNIRNFAKALNPPRVCILGSTGSGKTVFARKLTHQYQTMHKKIFVCDPKNEFNFPSLKRSDLLNRDFTRRITHLKLESGDTEDCRAISEYLGAFAWNFAPSILYLEEVAEYIHKSDELSVSHPLVYKVLQQGRAKNVGIITTSQQLRDIHLSFIRQANAILVFAMMPAELRALEGLFGFEGEAMTFDLPSMDEFNSGVFKELYSFYLIQPGFAPVHYRKLNDRRSDPEESQVSADT
jgi:DNA helicase HerA-like ATPase